MSISIRITAGQIRLIAQMNDSPTAQAICAALPIRASAKRWGEEIYFEIPVDVKRTADARAEMTVGELGYWPPGKALCIFFGPTPASSDDRPRAASPVNPIGRVTNDATALTEVPDGAEIILERN